MITVLLNITHLNDSLQVGDLVYTVPTIVQPGSNNAQSATINTGVPNRVGILSRITINNPNQVTLDIDETQPASNIYAPGPNDFLMFSKYSQTDGDVIGYYAQAKFINNSKEKAEIYSVGSEVIINSK